MANQTEIDDIVIDLDDQEAALKALKVIELKLGAGEKIVRAKIDGDDVTYNEGSLSWVERKIKTLEAEVARKAGRRRRHAARVRFV